MGFPYHLGGADTAPVSVHMRLAVDSRLRTIWDVIGKIPGSSDPNQWVVAGNHRDAWVYGASDPSSGTAAMLETVHGLGVLLQHGWKPRRTVIIASWDGEEEGLIGSTEWVEQHAAELHHAVAYFNIDVAVSGPIFNAAAVPSLREFIRDITSEVPSPAGGTVFDQWRKDQEQNPAASRPHPPPAPASRGSAISARDRTTPRFSSTPAFPPPTSAPRAHSASTTPSTTTSTGSSASPTPASPTTQQQARIFGLEILHMADADVLPYDYQAYAQEIQSYLAQARDRATSRGLGLNFSPALAAAAHFESAASAVRQRQLAPPADVAVLNRALGSVEPALLLPAGLPRRPWYRHSIYAPGEFTGYEAVVLPGVSEAIAAADTPRAQAQLDALAQALNRAADALAPH